MTKSLIEPCGKIRQRVPKLSKEAFPKVIIFRIYIYCAVPWTSCVVSPWWRYLPVGVTAFSGLEWPVWRSLWVGVYYNGPKIQMWTYKWYRVIDRPGVAGAHYAFRGNLTYMAWFQTYFIWLFHKTPGLRHWIWSSKSWTREMHVFSLWKALQDQ